MPIYEFYCPDNNRIYSFFARSPAMGSRTPRCPDNPKYRMVKQVSGFAVTGRRRDDDAAGGEADDLADDPRTEAMMAEMEREMAGMDEENPDPRQMARMMRRMADMTGEPVPSAMEEMIARMERGEDPEQLEEEYGDLLDEAMDDDASAEESPGDPRSARALLRRGRPPRRDPELYEMEAFL